MTVRICIGCGGPFPTDHPGRAKFCGQPCYFEHLRTRRPAIARFRALVAVAGDDDCWLWKGAPGKTGYGRFWLNDHQVGAHRASHVLLKGPVPDGLLVLHRCDNPRCVNPRHLFLGTHSENMVDKVSKGRANCARGERHGSRTEPHRVPRGEAKRAQCKLSKAAVAEIRTRSAGGTSQSTLAREYGVHQSLVSRVVRGLRWV